MFSIFTKLASLLFHEDVDSQTDLSDELEAQRSSTLPSRPRNITPPTTPRSHRRRSSPINTLPPAAGLSPKQKRRLRHAPLKQKRAQAQADGGDLYQMRTGNPSTKKIRKKEFWFRKAANSQGPVPKPSLVPSDSRSFTLADDDAPVTELSSILEAETTAPPRYAFGPTLQPLDLQIAYKWFHMVRGVVMSNGREDYKLDYPCTPRALVYMVHHGWVDLREALAWKQSRHLLGAGLVGLSERIGGLEKLCEGMIVEKPTNKDLVDFQKGWARSSDPANEYDWKADVEDRKKHGPFGPALARYATPEIQEKVLEALLRSDVPPDRIDLPGNWKPLFLSLFLRNRAPEEKDDNEHPQEGSSDKEEEKRDVPRKAESAVEQDNCEKRQGKGKECAILEAPRNEGESISCRMRTDNAHSRSFEMQADERMSGIVDMSAVNGGMASYQPWTGESQTSGLAMHAGQQWKSSSDVSMTEEVVGEPSAVRIDDTDENMSVEFTIPEQFADPQLGDRRLFSSAAGPSEGPSAGSGANYSEKRIKQVEVPQTSARDPRRHGSRPNDHARGQQHRRRPNDRRGRPGARNAVAATSDTSNFDPFVYIFAGKEIPNFAQLPSSPTNSRTSQLT